jgi:hypothetical protein
MTIADRRLETRLIGADEQIPSLCPSGVMGRWMSLSRRGAAGVWVDAPGRRRARKATMPVPEEPNNNRMTGRLLPGMGAQGRYVKATGQDAYGCLADVEATPTRMKVRAFFAVTRQA